MPEADVRQQNEPEKDASRDISRSSVVRVDARALDDAGIADADRVRALEEQYVAAEDWRSLCALYSQGAIRAPDAEFGLQMRLSAGLLSSENLQDFDGAELHLRRVLAFDPGNVEALEAIQKICEGAGRFQEAADCADRAIEAVEEPERPLLLIALAELAAAELDQPARAIDALGYANEITPGDPEILSRARALFMQQERWDDAKRVLDEEAIAAFGELSVDPRATSQDLEPDDASRIGAAYRELGVRLLEHASVHSLAEECLHRARSLGDEEALSQLDVLAHVRNDWEGRAAEHRDAGFSARDKRKAAAHYLQAAELYASYGNDLIRSGEYLDRCLILSAGYPPALRFIEATSGGPEHRQDLIKRLNGISAGVRDPGVKAQIMLRVANLLEEALAEQNSKSTVDLDEVINAYRRVLAIQPGHAEAVERLSAFLEQSDRHADRAQVLEAQLVAASNAYERTKIHLELGRTYAQLLGDSDRARGHFEAVMAHNPDHFDAAGALRALYKDAREQPLLLSVLKVLVTYSPDIFGRLEMLGQMSEVAAEVSKDEAFAVTLRIFELDPKSDGAADRIEAQAAELERPDALAETYVRTADICAPADAVAMLLKAAEIYDERMPRPAEAIRAFKRVLELSPGHEEAQEALERLLRQHDDPAALVEILKGRLADNTDPSMEPLLLSKIADVLDRELGDLEGAVEMYERVRALQSKNAAVLTSLEDLHRRGDNRREQVRILVEREALATDDAERAELMRRRARILNVHLGDKAEAAQIYLEILGTHPDQDHVIKALTQLVGEEVERAAISRGLQPIFARRGQHREELDMIDVILEETTQAADGHQVAEHGVQIAEERLNDAPRALGYALKAIEFDPSSEASRDAVVRLTDLAGAHEEVANRLAPMLDNDNASAEVRSALAVMAADLRDAHLADQDGAISLYQQAVHADPANVRAIAALERLLGAESRWEELAGLLSTKIEEASEPGTKARLGLSLGAIREEHLDDLEGAASAYRDALATDPENRGALAKLADVLERSDRHRELIGILDRMLVVVEEPAAKASVEAKAGAILHEKLDDPKGALERFERALVAWPETPQAVEGLQGLLADEAHRADAGTLLEPYFARTGRHRDRIAALDAQLSRVSDQTQRYGIFRQIAETLRADLERPDEAFDAWGRALREGLVPREELSTLFDLAVAADRAPAFAEILKERADADADDIELQRMLARLYDGAAASPKDARLVWERVLEKQPDDTEALEALERLTASGDDPEALAKVLIARAEASESLAEKLAFQKRASAILEEVAEDLPQAIAAMERAREMAPEDRGTLRELQRLYEVTERSDDLIEVLFAESELVDEPEQRAELETRLATLKAAADPAGAIGHFGAALEAVPEHDGARAGLEGLLQGPAAAEAAVALEPSYRARGEWEKLAGVYEVLADATSDPVERVERLVAIRSIYEERLGQLDRAFRAAARAYRDAPDSDELLLSLEQLGARSGQMDEYFGVLDDHAESLPYVSEERHQVRVRSARSMQKLSSDVDQVVAAWRRVLDEKPDSRVALEALSELYEALGQSRERVEMVRALAGISETAEGRTDRLLEAAAILDEKLGDRAGASRIYEQILMLHPDNATALIRLDAIYSDSRAHEDRARVMQLQVDGSKGQDRYANLHRLGRHKATTLGDLPGAAQDFATILAADDEEAAEVREVAIQSLDALFDAVRGKEPELAATIARTLEPEWAARKETVKWVVAKEAQMATAGDASERRALLEDIATIYEKELDQPEMAFLALTRAYAEHPTDSGLADRLEGLATRADTEEELADLYAQALPSVEEPELALRLARRAAYVYDTLLERGEDAIPFFNKILSLAPDDASALNSLERIHRRAGNARAQVEIYRGMLRASEEPDQRLALWGQIAALAEGELKNDDLGFEAYQEMLAIAPDDVEVLRKLRALCERTARLAQVAELLEKEISLLDEPDAQATALLELATFQKERLQDYGAAVEAFDGVLQRRPLDSGAVAGLAAIVRLENDASAGAAAVLTPVYEETAAFDMVVSTLEVRVAASEDPTERKALLVHMSKVSEEGLGSSHRAFMAASRALKEDPRDEALLDRLELLASTYTLDDDLVGVYQDALDTIDDRDLEVRLRTRVAEICEKSLDDRQSAIDEYNRILDVAPSHPGSLRALERLYKDADSFESLAEVYRRRIAQAEEDEDRVGLMREYARLQARQLLDAPGAISTLRRLLDIAPTDVAALGQLAELCRSQGRASEEADVLERLIEAAEPESADATQAMFELGRTKAENLGDIAGAHDLFRQVVARDPAHEGLRDFVEEQFEDAASEEDADAANAYGELLTDALRSTQSWSELISVLRIRARLAPDGLARVPLNREIAETYRDHMGQKELALSTFAQVFADAPAVEDTRVDLELLADELEEHETLADVYEDGLDDIPDPEERLAVERRIAELLDQNLRDGPRALDAYNRVLRSAPMDRQALEAVDRLNEAMGRWAAQTDVLEKRADLATENLELQHELFVRLGAIWDERLSEREEAVRAYRRARALQPDHKETLSALSLLLVGDDEAQELFEVLKALNEQAETDRVRVRNLSRMAELAGGALQQPSEGIDLWKQVLGLASENDTARKGLEDLYEQEGRWEELAILLESQIDRARDERELTRIQRRLGLIKGTRLGSVDDAVRSWTEILKRNPNDVEALSALRDIYRNAERYPDLVGTLRKLIPLQSDAEGVKEVRFELAEVYLTNLEQPEDAIESAKRVLDVEPHTVAELMRLEELFVQTGAFGEAVKVMKARAVQAESGGERVEILYDIAQIYETKIHRTAGAASAYEEILLDDPGSTKAYESLSSLYEKNGDYRKLVELINRRLDTIEDAEARRELLFKIIDIQERWLGQSELAFTAACRAFGEEGADHRAQEIAERLAEETDNWEILAEVYLEQIDQVGANRAVELRKRLGTIYLEKLEEPEEAEEQFSAVLSLRTTDDGAREMMLSMLAEQKRWPDVLEQLGEKVEGTTDPETKIGIFGRMAEIQEREVGDVEGAIASTKRVLDVDASNTWAINNLLRVFRESEKWHPLLNMLGRQLELTADTPTRTEILYEIGGVWETGIQDFDHASEAYRDVLAVSPGHPAALRALERLYTQQERWSELIDVYEQQISLTDDATVAIATLTRIATIHEERFRDLDSASGTLIRVLEVDPEHLPTIRSLERIWTQSESWDRLVEAHHRHVELTEDPKEAVDLYLKIGTVELDQLDNVVRAEEALNTALEINSESREVIHALGRLHERNGSWFNALEMLQREANILGSDPASVELHYRMGHINEEMMMDHTGAMAAYRQSIDLDEGYTPALQALRRLEEADQNHEAVVNLLAQEAEYTEALEDKSLLFQQAADMVLEKFDDVEQAVTWYEASIAAKPDHTPSLAVISDLYFSEEQWDEAEGTIQRLVDQLDAREDAEDLSRHYYRLAYIAEKHEDDHLALRRYHSSYECDATYLPTLEGLAAALLRSEKWEDAQRILQTILIQHKASLTDAEVVDLYYQLGEIGISIEDLPNAEKNFKKAMALDREHIPTLSAAASLAERLEAWEDAYDRRERLIGLLDEEERFDVLVTQAHLCRDRIGEPYRAIDAYVEARRLRPESEDVLRALSELFEQTGQVPRVIEVLQDLARISPDQTERRNIYMQLAKTFAAQRDPGRAIESLNAALDIDPLYAPAFAHIEQVLFEMKNWEALEENYLRMINRFPKTDKKARLAIWRPLSEFYAKALRDPAKTRTALEVICGLDPEDVASAERLAMLLSETPGKREDAIRIYHALLERSAKPDGPARRLFQLYWAMGRYDRAFCALQGLMLMKAANDDERGYYDFLLKYAPQTASRSLTNDLWQQHLFHPSCRGALKEICSVMFRGGPSLFRGELKTLNVRKKWKVDLDAKGRGARARLRYFSVWRRLADAMAVGPMEHLHKPDVGDAPRLFPGIADEHNPTVLYAGEKHACFQAMSPRQISWILARQMALARPELAPASALPPVELGAAIEAAIQLFYQGSGVAENLDLNPQSVELWKRRLGGRLSERAITTLKGPVRRALEGREMRKLREFVRGVEHTAARTALLFSADVRPAETVLQEAATLVQVRFNLRVRALMLFALSEDHFVLREKLGLAIPERKVADVVRSAQARAEGAPRA